MIASPPVVLFCGDLRRNTCNCNPRAPSKPCWASSFPTDVLVEILRRLPHSCRRRARLVCRRWRDVVNERITETLSNPKLLIWSLRRRVAYLADDLSSSSKGRCTELWRASDPQIDYRLIGTCNGLLCLGVNHRGVLGGVITMVNAATGETLPIPPMTCAALFIGSIGWKDWHDAEAYSFAYHRITGQFKVVHVPCSYERVIDFHSVHVFTLGSTTWREVSAGPGGAMCKLAAGVVSVDGVTYWVTINRGAAAKIVSFDLTDDHVISTTTPVPARHDRCRLTEVHGKLGYVVWPNVWVLEAGQRWSHRYSFERRIPLPHFVFGERVLTCNWPATLIYGRRPKGTPSSDKEIMCDDGLELVGGHQDGRTLVAEMKSEGSSRHDYEYETFAYVETMEPLSIYARNK